MSMGFHEGNFWKEWRLALVPCFSPRVRRRLLQQEGMLRLLQLEPQHLRQVR